MYILDNGKFKEGIIFWDTDIDRSADVDVFFYMHDYDKRAEHAYGFLTLVIDLKKLSNEEIIEQYKPNRRNEIKKALTIGYKDIMKSKLTEKEVKEYVKNYNSFANFKKLSKTTESYINQLNNDGKLYVSYMYLDDILLSVHSHYVDHKKTRARLLHSFSLMNDFSSNINANANKLLTHMDLLNFKEIGVAEYDFGGIGTVDGDNEKFKGIIQYKKGFGGTTGKLWKGVTPNGEDGSRILDEFWGIYK